MNERRTLVRRLPALNSSFIGVYFTEASLELRKRPVYADTASLACVMYAQGQVYMEEEDKPIRASIIIETAEHRIKCGERDHKKYLGLNLKEYGWSKEPETYWGEGAFLTEIEQLRLCLYCTDKEFPILQTIVRESLQSEGRCSIGLHIGHPDYMTEPDWDGNTRSTDEYVGELIDQGVPFYVTGWSVKTDLRAKEQEERKLPVNHTPHK